MKIIIGWLYPDLMSTYGDRGNIICLMRRCQWRGIKVEVKDISLDSTGAELKSCDLLFMGGAQDRQQQIAANDLRKNKGKILKQLLNNGMPSLFVCGAYQFLGKYYLPAQGKKILGLGIFDLYTQNPGLNHPRLIGNIVIKLNKQVFKSSYLQVVGFENHGGRTFLGKTVTPLGEVIVGFGNNDLDRTEGVIFKNAIGTYLHGPILPKNPYLADWLIRKALEFKLKKKINLVQLDDKIEWQAHQTILHRLGV